MNKKAQDIFLALLSSAGVFWIIGRFYGLIIDLVNLNNSLELLKYMVLFESVLLLISGLIIWKKIKFSDAYNRFFIIFFIIALMLDLAYKLVIILG